MASRTWTVTLNNSVHTVELLHHPWPGGTAMRVDGQRLPLDAVVLNQLTHMGFEQVFYLAGHRCVVYIYLRGFGYRYALAVDGRDVDTGLVPEAVERMPIWGWALVFACLAVSFYVREARAALIPALLGAIACWWVVRRLRRDRPPPLLAGGLVVVLVWATGIVFNGGLFVSWDDTNYWVDFAPDGGAFTVSVPEPLHGDNDPLKFDTPNGPLPMHSFTVKLNRVGYWVDYADLPGAASADPQRVLLAIGDNLADGADVRSNIPITLGPYPGREIQMFDEKEQFNRIRFYLLGGRLYDVWAIAPTDSWDKSQITKFLDSLRLLGPTPTPEHF